MRFADVLPFLCASSGRVSRASDPIVVGRLDRDAIEAVVYEHCEWIDYCYERRLRVHPELAGEVTVKLVISGIGTVAEVEIASSTLDDAAVLDCLLVSFGGVQFPAPANSFPVIVNYSLLFSPT